MNYSTEKIKANGTEEEYQSSQEWRKILTDTIPNQIKNIVGEGYSTKGSYGQPKSWATVPWVSIYDDEVTTTSQEGVYIVYLFKADLSGFYLSLGLGTDYFEQFGKDKLTLLRTSSEDIRYLLKDNYDMSDLEFRIDLASDKKRPTAYVNGTVCAKYYDSDNLPSNEEIINDLNYFLELYEYVKNYYNFDSLNTVSSKDSKIGVGDGDVETINYWLYAPGEQANKWKEFYNEKIMAIGWEIGDLRKYRTKQLINNRLKRFYKDDVNHFNDALCLWQFTHEIQVGDIIFAKRGMNEIIGIGIVESDYEYDKSRGEYTSYRKVDWKKKGSWRYGDKKNKLAMKTLTKITDYKEFVKELIELVGGIEPEPPSYPIYTKKEFLDEVYVSKDDYKTLVKLLKNKKNLIVQGAPGVGKTFMAKRLAYSIMGIKNVDRVMMVQFHQSYSYEDFVEGYRPSKEHFELRKGSFYKFCKKAEDDDENDYFFIIDEINRGNLSKIFGELFMLIENDKRGEKNKIQLLYSDELFYIPKNVHIIGLMNTADRSLAMIDYALRRRFAFFDLKPGFSSDGFETYQSNINYSIFDSLIGVMEELNNAIKDDETLGEGFRIGHSYFCNLDQEEDIEEKLNYIVEYEIIPLLKEYWFDEPDKVEEWSEKLRNSLNE